MEMDMQHRVMGYDRASTMFSPDGRLLQVEYAEKTVRLGSASIGIACSDGVVVIADRRVLDTLLVESSAMKIWDIDTHIVSSAAGILSDARMLLERAQVISQQHRITYDGPVDVESVIRDLANIQQSATQYAGARPFGVEVMLAGVNKTGEGKVYVSDVTGNYSSYRATAIGENDEQIKEMLRQNKETLTMEKGIKFALNIFKKLLGKAFNVSRFEVAYVPKKEKEAKKICGDALVKYTK
ncbi:MAG: archaeal proteasome endopeptidase complex subunit alpha [Candidatus Methylomirabilota bacterium]